MTPRTFPAGTGSDGPGRPSRAATAVAAVTGALAAAAVLNAYASRQAEREQPPRGRFLVAEGVRLHYLERQGGVDGPPLVLLHGNMTMAEEVAASGLLDRAARQHARVVAFDRPGYGYSARPRGRVWTPQAQADLLAAAIRRLGLARPVVAGHSFGAVVALALALRQPEAVRGVALLSGYYYPTARVDVPVLAPPALPVLGDVLRYTISPLLLRLAWPGLLRLLFGPAPTNPRFDALKGLVLRPGQIRASAAESALLVPSVAALSSHYGELRVPAAIAAGADDRYIDPEAQSVRLHRALPGSTLRVVPGAGHMLHHTAPDVALAAIAAAASRPSLRPATAAA